MHTELVHIDFGGVELGQGIAHVVEHGQVAFEEEEGICPSRLFPLYSSL